MELVQHSFQFICLETRAKPGPSQRRTSDETTVCLVVMVIIMMTVVMVI